MKTSSTTATTQSVLELDLNRTNLSELSQVKESDILNDDDNESISMTSLNISRKFSSLQQQQHSHTPNTSIRSPSTNFMSNHHAHQLGLQSHTLNKNIIIKKRNSSVSSEFSPQQQQQVNTYFTLSNPQHQITNRINKTPSISSTVKIPGYTNSPGQSSLDDLLLTNKNKHKMNQIEDALASVLDDMKQLDFSTNPNNNSSVQTTRKTSIKLEQDLKDLI